MKFDRLWWLVPRRHDTWRATHAARHYYDCALELDLPDWNSFDHTPHLELPEFAYASASAFLQSRGIGVDRPLVAVHPGGAGLSGLKRWPTVAFAASADRLVDELDAQIIVVGGQDERSLAHDVSGHMQHSAVIAAGQLPLLASFALLAACDLFIGDDSSLLHAAAALGTPYVGVMGPTSPASFRPLARRPGQGRVVVPNPPCIEMSSFVGSSVIWDRPECSQFCAALAALPPDRVIRAALEQLQVSRGSLTPVT
jgi:ADP-heptose:LPS heptosyltransferase